MTMHTYKRVAFKYGENGLHTSHLKEEEEDVEEKEEEIEERRRVWRSKRKQNCKTGGRDGGYRDEKET